MSKADLLLRCGGFERAETYTVAFATEGNTQYVHPELAGLRIPLDGYTAVVDYVRASFLGGCVVDVNQPSICLYFAPCADLTSLRIVPEGEAGFTLNLSGEKGTE